MATLTTRLNELERKVTETDTSYTFKIYRSGREVETPIAYTHYQTHEVFAIDDSRFDTLKGYNVFFAEYAPAD